MDKILLIISKTNNQKISNFTYFSISTSSSRARLKFEVARHFRCERHCERTFGSLQVSPSFSDSCYESLVFSQNGNGFYPRFPVKS